MKKCISLHKYLRIGLILVLVLALLATLLYMVLPRRNDPYHPRFNQAAVDAYTRDYLKSLSDYDSQNEKEAFSIEEMFPNGSYSIPTLADMMAQSNIVVRGKITAIEYTQIEDMGAYLVQGGHFMVWGGPFGVYSVQITQQMMGNLGLNRNIRVLLHGEPDTLANPRLAVGDEVICMLVETLHKDVYYPVYYEHSVFEVEADGGLYAFSNFNYICEAYDGQPAKKLIKDIKEMKRKMRLREWVHF